jgi:hypothetical protein
LIGLDQESFPKVDFCGNPQIVPRLVWIKAVQDVQYGVDRVGNVTMRGDWTVQVEDGTHAIHAELSGNWLFITWDGAVVQSSFRLRYYGDLWSFQRNAHSFLLRVRGWGMFGTLVLFVDGVEVPKGGVLALTKPAPALAPAQFVKELSAQESEEIVGTEQYPLDNRFGDQTFTTVRQASRESTNELSIDTSSQLRGKIGLDVLAAIKAEIEAQISRQTGFKIGEKVTESQTLTFSVGPKSLVLYEVVWKRKVRSGERLYVVDGNSVTIPYKISYGLSCEVRTR